MVKLGNRPNKESKSVSTNENRLKRRRPSSESKKKWFGPETQKATNDERIQQEPFHRFTFDYQQINE